MFSVRVEGMGPYLRRRHGDGGLQGSVLRLRRRGWVFQENLLSPRTLYFGEDGIRWECLEMNRDEAHTPSGECGCRYHNDDPYLFKQNFAILESKFQQLLAYGKTTTRLSTANGGQSSSSTVNSR